MLLYFRAHKCKTFCIIISASISFLFLHMHFEVKLIIHVDMRKINMIFSFFLEPFTKHCGEWVTFSNYSNDSNIRIFLGTIFNSYLHRLSRLCMWEDKHRLLLLSLTCRKAIAEESIGYILREMRAYLDIFIPFLFM